VLKALFLGFFCCCELQAGDEEKEPLAIKKEKILFALKEVHPSSRELAPAVENGEKMAPPGYKLIIMTSTDVKGKKHREPLLLSRRNIVSADAIEAVRATGRLGEIAVRLTKSGGERVANSSGKMNFGRDRIAVIYEDRCLIAPTVQAKLSRDFVINGLDGKKEVDSVLKALNAAIK
jgi:hypothetical protein